VPPVDSGPCEIEAILLANAAAVEGNLLRVEGGGWGFVEPDFFPTTIGGSLCGVLAVDADDFGSTFSLELSVTDTAGEVDAHGSMIIDARETSVEMSTPRIPRVPVGLGGAGANRARCEDAHCG
jgi:hypothetical protein